MKPEAGVYALMALLLATACAVTPASTPGKNGGFAMDSAAAGGESSGYLDKATTPNAVNVIPPAPKQGEPRNDSDWAIFKATRAYKGSERWAMAVNDDSYKPADLLRDFSCSVDGVLTPENAPTVAKILARVGTDASNAGSEAKNFYKRKRPFTYNAGDICIERSKNLEDSFDYPSGHAGASWVEGLALAELAPDRSTQILQRARAYGESRIVCGVHNWSAVEAGRTNGASVYAALHGSTEFMSDMAKAKAEVAAARAAKKPDAAACTKEFELTKPLPVQ